MKKTTDQLDLIPPYCPNSHCRFHFGTNESFCVKNGWAKTDKAPFFNQRYRCRECKIQFSANTFNLDFRKRLVDHSEKVLHYTLNGMSNNSVSRLLKIAERTVRNRLKNMAQQALFFEKQNSPEKLMENVAYDGFETFTHSQFSPCYINTAVGSRSHFIYHNTFSPLNRKGRMTQDQKEKNQELIKKHGLYPQNSVFKETCYIMKGLSKIGEGRTLFSDEHKAYFRAHKATGCGLKHETISSKQRRDPSNPLFPINHLHGLYRHFFSSQHRETIAFQKHEGALLEKMQLMKIYRNFMNPKFVKKNKFDPHAHEWSPGMYLGLTNKVLSFEEVFGVRKRETQFQMDQREKEFVHRDYPYSRRVISK